MADIGRIEKARRDVERQRKWIAEHGGDLEGYRRHYGGMTLNPDAIYSADRKELAVREDMLQHWVGKLSAITRGERPLPHLTGTTYTFAFVCDHGDGEIRLIDAKKEPPATFTTICPFGGGEEVTAVLNPLVKR